jgi:hypothetical protein
MRITRKNARGISWQLLDKKEKSINGGLLFQ